MTADAIGRESANGLISELLVRGTSGSAAHCDWLACALLAQGILEDFETQCFSTEQMEEGIVDIIGLRFDRAGVRL